MKCSSIAMRSFFYFLLFVWQIFEFLRTVWGIILQSNSMGNFLLSVVNSTFLLIVRERHLLNGMENRNVALLDNPNVEYSPT